MKVQKVQNLAKLRPCEKCSKLFVGVADGYCAKCEKNDKYYKKTRQKGDPRDFLDYPELLEKWRARRRECILWRKEAMDLNEERNLRKQLESEKSIYLAVLYSVDLDLDVIDGLGKEITELNKEIDLLKQRLESARRYGDYRDSISFGHTASVSSIPTEQWRRLVQLVHPDKHENSTASTEVMQWLLQNRPIG